MTRKGARLMKYLAAFPLAVFLLAAQVKAQGNPAWTDPIPPFRIAGNLYYVGTRDLASYLVTTPDGHILINSNLDGSVALIQSSVEKLGFKFGDIKILLISHGHFDHTGGSAEVKRITGAKFMVMDGDVSVVESGGKTDFNYANDASFHFPPTHVDRVLHDGDEVALGGTTLVAHKTPGHTKGCTTWTMKLNDGGRTYNVVIVGSPNVNPGYKLVANASYPEIASDYERSFSVLKSLPIDIFLGAHGGYFDLEKKYARMQQGDRSALIDPAGYKAYVTEREQAFRRELARQRLAADTTKAAAQPAIQTDSAKARSQPTETASHSHKILWWTAGIALFVALNLLLSDRPQGK